MIAVEWWKQVRRPRTAATLAAVVAFVVVLAVALTAAGPGRTEFVGDVPLVVVPRSSGFALPLVALSSTMKFFLPLAVSIFAAESVAGDAAWGSLRYVLARPVSRRRVLWTKAVVAVGLSAVAVVLLVVVATALGGALSGWHPLAVGDGATSVPGHPHGVVLGAGAVVGRLSLAVLYVGAGMASIFAVAFFLSTTTRRPLVAVAGGVAVTVVSRVFNADYLPGVAVVNRYMPNNDIDLWQHLFTRPADLGGVPHFLLLQAAFVVVFLAAADRWFTRKDVLS